MRIPPRLLVWLLLAWFIPAAVAGALGWNGIWGTGSAFADYLVPLPVAGGVLHLLTLLPVAALLLTQPWRGPAGALARPLLLGGALAGLLLLRDPGELMLAAGTDAAAAGRWQEQPLGLFLLSDCLLALVFSGAFGARGPASPAQWALALPVMLALPLLVMLQVQQLDPRQREVFVYTGGHPGPARGDAEEFYFTKEPPGSAAFAQAVPAVIARHDPRSNINSEDVAVYFLTSLDGAQRQDRARTVYTLCLYQDGAPVLRTPGLYDCFAAHETFSERLARAGEAQPHGLPPEVRQWLARRAACAGRPPFTPRPGEYLDNQELRACDPARAAQERAALQVQFAQEAAVQDILRAY